MATQVCDPYSPASAPDSPIPLTWTRTSLASTVPSPSCSLLFAPQHSTDPLESTARELERRSHTEYVVLGMTAADVLPTAVTVGHRAVRQICVPSRG